MITENESEICRKVFKKETTRIENLLDKLFLRREPKSLYEPCTYALKTGGKRLRPFLVIVAAKAVGGKFKEVYNAALSVELLHNFTLVHDDIMDNSEKRRGRPTVHKQYDINTAILTGDNLVSLAYERLLMDCCDFSKSVITTFTNGIIEVCEGQSLDKAFELRNDVSIDEYKVMIYKKTAALAEMCCSIGAQLCGGKKEEVKAAENYGKNVGMAFQIQDDLLDIVGDESKFGKAIGSDLVEGKKTYLFIKALEKSSGNTKKELLKVVKNKGIKRNEIEKYKSIYENLGVIDDAKKEIVRYTDIAIKNLNKLSDKNGRLLMEWLAYELIGRKK